MKTLLQACLILVVHTLVISAKRRRLRFSNCPLARTNSDLLTVEPARSRIECSVICLNEPDCLSASYCKTTDGYTCQLSGFYAEGSCSGLVAEGVCSQTAIVNPCENAGTFNPQNRTCHCVEGFVGEYCQRRYRDCSEAPGGNRVYLIQPFGSDYIFEWKCYQGSYSVTELVFTTNYNYTHTWQAIKHGLLQTPRIYFFLGLERLHQLTKQGRYDMFVSMVMLGKEKGFLWYRNVRVDSEADGYALHWDYFEREDRNKDPSTIFQDGFGGAGEVAKNLNGARYGTYDNDVNGCAKRKNIGWWYNPLGCMAMDIAPNGIFWPVIRNGTIENEYMDIFKIGLKVVHFYEEDDLVLRND